EGERGGEDRPRAGGPFERMGRGGMFGGMFDWMERMLGIDPPARVEDLPLGQDARLVANIPVGGIENFQTGRPGLKVEQVFRLTEEQTKALEELRKEYAAERDKIAKEMEEAHRKLAERARELRKNYETKANDVLGGDLKAVKEKLDAIVKEYNEKRMAERKGLAERLAALRVEMEKAREEGPEAMRALMEKNNDLMGLVRQQTERDYDLSVIAKEQMKTAVSEDARAKLEEAFKRREAWRAIGPGGGPPGAPGGAGPGGGRGNPGEVQPQAPKDNF
ncbi:MAG: hypothetical protein N3A38_03850, partial [Planctomycetota bacterium]|nr:hypothetical protein [Planctomycetota bacterium]